LHLHEEQQLQLTVEDFLCEMLMPNSMWTLFI